MLEFFRLRGIIDTALLPHEFFSDGPVMRTVDRGPVPVVVSVKRHPWIIRAQ